MEGVPLTAETLGGCDLVVVLSDHVCVDYRWVVENARHVLDTRNATRGAAEAGDKVTLL
jgi:UDP-N-acetyl-D-glucosamine dehydrogenase